MKLELDVWHYLLDVYTKFRIDISKHVEKSPENFEKSKPYKNNRQNSENKIFAKAVIYVKKYIAGHVYTKFEEFTLIHGAMIANNNNNNKSLLQAYKVHGEIYRGSHI